MSTVESAEKAIEEYNKLPRGAKWTAEKDGKAVNYVGGRDDGEDVFDDYDFEIVKIYLVENFS